MGIDSVVSGVVWDSLEARVGWALARKGVPETLFQASLGTVFSSCRKGIGPERGAGKVVSDVTWDGLGARVGRALVRKGCQNR